jgi:hypothetical protein
MSSTGVLWSPGASSSRLSALTSAAFDVQPALSQNAAVSSLRQLLETVCSERRHQTAARECGGTSALAMRRAPGSGLGVDVGLHEPYQAEDGTGIWIRQGRDGHFDYSDGDAAEAEIYRIITCARDRRSGSEELAAHIHSWAMEYHFSPSRANLLRPFAHAKTCSGSSRPRLASAAHGMCSRRRPRMILPALSPPHRLTRYRLAEPCPQPLQTRAQKGRTQAQRGSRSRPPSSASRRR